jgi:hypothetical protein
VKNSYICEICHRKVEMPMESGQDPSGSSSTGALTGDSDQGIMDEAQDTREVFSSLCPNCREEIWSTDTLSLQRYPYRN